MFRLPMRATELGKDKDIFCRVVIAIRPARGQIVIVAVVSVEIILERVEVLYPVFAPGVTGEIYGGNSNLVSL